MNTDYANGTLVCADEGTVDVYIDSKTRPCVAAGHGTVQEGLSMVSQTWCHKHGVTNMVSQTWCHKRQYNVKNVEQQSKCGLV